MYVFHVEISGDFSREFGQKFWGKRALSSNNPKGWQKSFPMPLEGGPGRDRYKNDITWEPL